jgi:hypothetical protein
MSFKNDKPRLSFEEIVAIVRELPTRKQKQLAEELQRAGLKAKWDEILAAFAPNMISEREIVRTSKEVRRELMEERRNAVVARRR